MDHADEGGDDDVFVYMGGSIPQHLRGAITHVRIHESVKIITRHAFMGCRNLVSIEMHDGVEIIEEYAFLHCWSLRRIKLPGVRIIGKIAFYDCTALTDVEFGNKLETIGLGAFESTDLRSINIPKVRTIGNNAFAACWQLTEVDLSKDLETIEDEAFWKCPRLRRIALPLEANLLGNDVFDDCLNLSQVDLVGEIHKTISSLLLDSWRNEMNDEIDRINQLLPNTLTDLKTFEIHQWIEGVFRLPNTPHLDKTAVIQQWMERVRERIEYYKSERASDDEVMEETTMNGQAFDQPEELKQQNDPKEQAAIQNDSISRREEDETDKSASSAGGGSNLEDDTAAKEIEGMPVETKDGNSFGGGNQNDDFHMDLEGGVRSEEGRQFSFAQSTEVSEEESEIQQLKAQLKEAQKRLDESEEENNRQKKEYESKVEVLEEENGRLNKRLKVSVQTNAEQVKEELMECLWNHKIKLGRSKVDHDGVGAIAMADISKDTRLFHFNGAPTNETIALTEDDIKDLPLHVQRVVKMYTRPNDDGLRDVPKNGFSFALGISWYLNTADGTVFEPNVGEGPDLDDSGFAELIALRDIEPGEELLLGYDLSETK